MHTVRWFFALTLIILVTPVFGQEPVTLAWKFKEGQEFFQELTTKTKQTMKVMGSDITQSQEQTFTYSWKVEKKEGDNWLIKQEIKAVKMSISIAGQPIEYDSTKEQQASSSLGDFFKALVGSQFTLKINKDFKVIDIQGREAFLQKLGQQNPQMEALLKQILNEDALKQMADPTFAAVPPMPVKPNQTWPRTIKVEMGPIGTYDTSYTYTYEGKDKDKPKLDKIKVETSLKYQQPSDATATSNLPFKIVKADLKTKNSGGTILFDNDKGRVESADMRMNLEGDLTIDIAGQTTVVNLNQSQTTTVKTTDTNPVPSPTPKKP